MITMLCVLRMTTNNSCKPNAFPSKITSLSSSTKWCEETNDKNFAVTSCLDSTLFWHAIWEADSGILGTLQAKPLKVFCLDSVIITITSPLFESRHLHAVNHITKQLGMLLKEKECSYLWSVNALVSTPSMHCSKNSTKCRCIFKMCM